MKTKHYILMIIAFFALFFSLFLTGCMGKTISGIKMANEDVIEIQAGNIAIDDIKVVVIYSDGETKEIDLTLDMIPEVEKLNFYKMGEHDVKIVVADRYTTTMKINVVRHEFDDIYKLEDQTVVYDGQPHKIEINYEVPEGTTVDYLYGNTFTNAGEYDVVAVISKAGYNSKTLKAKLIIEKADIDISGVTFEDQNFVYDGQPKTIEATNIPEGTSVEYEVWNEDKSVRLNLSNIVNVGVYKMIAKFKSADDNYNQTAFKEATLTINKEKYDMSEVSMNDFTKEYDNKEFEAKLNDTSVLPSGVSVSFNYYNAKGEAVKSPIDAGEYKVVASFKGDSLNYEEIAPIESKLTITKQQVNIDGKITFNSMTKDFDGNEYEIKVNEESLPTGVEVTYENNKHTIAGEYKAVAHFTLSNPNQVLDITELEAYLIINRITENFKVKDSKTGEIRDFVSDDIDIKPDKVTGNKIVNIMGFRDDKYILSAMVYTNTKGEYVDENDLSHGQTYNYNIVVELIDQNEKASITVPPISGIIKPTIQFDEEIKLKNLEVVYDGKAHGLRLNKELPIGTKVEYPNGEEFTDVGLYEVQWKISRDTYETKVLEGTLKITKATYDMSKVVIEDVTRPYDGNAYTPQIKDSPTYNQTFDNLPSGVSVKSVTYWLDIDEDGVWEEITAENAADYTKDAGKYKIIISYSYDESNYEALPNKEFILTVTPQTIDLSAIKFNNKTINANSVTAVGVAWMGIDDVPFDEYEGTDTAKIILKRSENLPEIIGVIYDYKDSNNNLIFTVDTTSQNIYYVSNDYPNRLGYETTNGDVWCDFSVFNTAGTYNVTARFVLNSGYNPTNYKLSVQELNATLTVVQP
ncbi:MAG: hypothetical protein IKP12_03420 [Acholeplasmatales bacterium]|nr:hypothetical protein [Acholeplasmatales bacterium]